MLNISQLESSLWEAADQLRANSKLNANEYSMPVLGLIFLRHATNRFNAVKAEIEKGLSSRGGKKRPITIDDFKGKSAIFLLEQAQDEEDFEERMREIHLELASLNEEAVELAAAIATNFEELGI